MAQRTAPRRKLISTRVLQRLGVSLLLIVMLFLAGSLLLGFVQRAWQEHQLNRAIERQSAQNAHQRERNNRLKGAAEFAESDVAAEQAARERLGMAREGETVLLPTVVLPPPPTPAPATAPIDVAELTAADGQLARSEPNVVRWMHAVFPGNDAAP
ncbi:MAG TPA: septum formation initiator family protein [Herpetosiphonaceae bacterium]|nr:septum formation initiator family protein [Herpetosiphonaceae bacterium]